MQSQLSNTGKVINFTNQEHEEFHNQRKELRVSDQVVILDRYNRVAIRRVTKVTPRQVTIGMDTYRIEDGRGIGGFPHGWLRGLATPTELDAWQKQIAELKRKEAEQEREQQAEWAKLSELDSLFTPLGEAHACVRKSEMEGYYMVDGLTELDLRRIGEALLKSTECAEDGSREG